MNFCFFFLKFVLLFLFYQNIIKAQPKYTSKEKDVIKQFRELVKKDLYMDYMNSDTYLIKWLQATNFNKNDAKQMLREALKWRKEHKVDTILTEKLDNPLNKIFNTDGTDYNGSLVATGFTSRIDSRGIIVAGKRYSVGIRMWIQFWESILQDVMKRVGATGNNIQEGSTTDLITLLVDFNGYNLRQHACLRCFALYAEWFQIWETYYPGFIKHLIFLNAPRIVGPLLEFLKPLMSEQTRNAVQTFGSNRTEWRDVIDKIVPVNELRVEFGGNKSN